MAKSVFRIHVKMRLLNEYLVDGQKRIAHWVGGITHWALRLIRWMCEIGSICVFRVSNSLKLVGTRGRV